MASKHHTTPASFSFAISSGTSSTFCPASRTGGSSTLSISCRGERSTPRSPGVFLATSFFFAFCDWEKKCKSWKHKKMHLRKNLQYGEWDLHAYYLWLHQLDCTTPWTLGATVAPQVKIWGATARMWESHQIWQNGLKYTLNQVWEWKLCSDSNRTKTWMVSRLESSI